MRLRRLTTCTLIGIALGTVVLSGCGEPDDKIYVSNITDSHGRVCTFVFTTREGEGWGGEGRDVDVSQLDCEYPPAGRTPGQPTTVPLSPP